MDNADKIVYRLLETQTVPVCAGCEKEFGPARLEPGQVPSHGYCRRHQIQMFTQPPLNWSEERATEHINRRPATDVQYWHDLHRETNRSAAA